MIHHYKKPVIQQQRVYQSPLDQNYNPKNWGRPVAFRTPKRVRLTIDVDFDYPEEDSSAVRDILEKLGSLLAKGDDGGTMNYDMKYPLGRLEGYFTEHKDHERIAHIPEGVVGPVDRFPRHGKIPIRVEPPPDERTAHEVSKASMPMRIAELVNTIKEQPISEEMKIALGEFSMAWIDIIVKAIENSSLIPDSMACPGCLPGEGITEGCNHPDGHIHSHPDGGWPWWSGQRGHR